MDSSVDGKIIRQKFFRVRNRVERFFFNSHSESHENLLVRAEVPSLLNRRLQDIAILMYKVDELFKQKSTSYHQ